MKELFAINFIAIYAHCIRKKALKHVETTEVSLIYQRHAYKQPLVEGMTPAERASISSAMRKALANALNTVSA